MVAQESRKRKNFSSYHAIISGLQTHAVHRLEKTWAEVNRLVTNNTEYNSNFYENRQINGM